MEVNYKKTILTTLLVTLLALVVSAVLMFMLLYFVFSKDLADFCYKLGNYNMASNLYLKSYQKSGKIDSCYQALILDIRTDDYAGVVKDYELFVSDKEYTSFMQTIIIGNGMVAGGVLEKSALSNEYNYLEDKYIMSLIEINEEDRAFLRAVSMFSGYNDYTFENQGFYSLNRFVSSDNLKKFETKYDDYEDVLLNEMQEYFNISKELFDSKDGDLDLQNKAYLVALGNRLITVGEDINYIYSALKINGVLVQSNQQNMIRINDKIKGMI